MLSFAVLSRDPAGVSCFRANEMQIRCDFLQVVQVASPFGTSPALALGLFLFLPPSALVILKTFKEILKHPEKILRVYLWQA